MDTVSPALIFPLHEVRDPAKLVALTESMRRSGWQGRPLLVLLDGDTRLARTGSHRLAAAIAAGLNEVPVIYIDGSTVVASGDHEGEALVEAVRFVDQEWMPELFDAAGCDEAAALMREEIAANEADEG